MVVTAYTGQPFNLRSDCETQGRVRGMRSLGSNIMSDVGAAVPVSRADACQLELPLAGREVAVAGKSLAVSKI